MGYEFRRPAKGRHEIWWHPQTRKYTTISYHEAKDIPKGTMSAILKDLGITREELV
ncbi:MAG: type II toxin-antitoxin system HicA family toxin [Chloroflexi bacterium]|nr:type II toxin-antitoxin system HicA family toxin [Chloroflexota bacterium]